MKRSEICLIKLDPTVGAEIKNTRPAVIVNNDRLGKLPLKVILLLTDWKEKYAIVPWVVKVVPNTINKLSEESLADCFQVRSVPENRFMKKVGILSDDIMEDIGIALATVLKLT